MVDWSVLSVAGKKGCSFGRHNPVFVSGSPIERMIYLVRGSVQVQILRPDGYQQIVERYGPGTFVAPHSMFGESYLFSAEATTLVDAIEYPIASFRPLLENSELRRAWDTVLYNRVISNMRRLEVLGYSTVAERLDAWIRLYGEVPGKGEYTSVANEINVSREALYREISRRRKFGENQKGTTD